MQQTQLYVGQSLHRAQQFLVTRADVVGSANASEQRKQLDQAVTAFDSAVLEQETSTREVRGEVNRRRQLERALVRKFMTPLAKFARASLVGVPEFLALTPSAQRLKRTRLVNTARSMVTAAEKYSAQLGAAEFPAGYLTQFREAVDSIGASLDTTAAKLVARTGSTNRIASAGKQGRQAIALLDSVVTHLILGDERLEREWRAAKRMRRVGTAEVVPIVESAAAPSAGSHTPHPDTVEVTEKAA